MTEETIDTGYNKFRGKCKEFAEAACVDDPTLRLVRGKYYCPIWNTEEPHWWTVHEDGSIYDPTKDQFPSHGLGFYEEFDGMVSCDNCGRSMQEKDIKNSEGRYVFCSYRCHGRFVGVF